MSSPPARGAQITGSPQPRLGCSMRAKTGPARPNAQSVAPHQSTRPFGWCSSGSSIRRRTSVAAIGSTLMAKTQRQEATDTRNPPSTGPNTAEVPLQAVQVPIARPAASPRKLDMISASELGTRSAPKMPCTNRAAIRIPTLGATAQAREATRNPTSPATRIRLRP